MAAAVDNGPYKVPKQKALILIKTPPLPPEWKTLFVSSCAESHGGSETISDILRADRSFIPFLDDRDGFTLIRRRAIRWIRIEEAESVEWYYYQIRQGAPQSVIRCHFEDGEVLEGTVYSIGPVGEQRVQDIVNRREDFLHLDSGTGLYLVNLRHITRLTVREDALGSPR